MSTGQIVFISITGALLYLSMVVIVGAALTARVKKDLNGDYWGDDQTFGVGAGAIFWIFGLMYLAWLALSDRILTAGSTKKCILCGTTNESDSAHCKHCGNLMGAEIGK